MLKIVNFWEIVSILRLSHMTIFCYFNVYPNGLQKKAFPRILRNLSSLLYSISKGGSSIYFGGHVPSTQIFAGFALKKHVFQKMF